MKLISIIPLFLSLLACATSQTEQFAVSHETVKPGSAVKLGGKETPLYQGQIKTGDDFAKVAAKAGLEYQAGVSVINVVPSVDTPVCESQTHILGETQGVDPRVQKITISRDLPMAQSRFAKDAKLGNISYLSDYKSGSFGKNTGLMIKGPELLARAVIVTDHQGIIKLIQIVPDVATLPDMDKAFKLANELAKKAN